jgi:hypothetical protein
VQRHLKYAEDSMAKGVAKNVASAKDCIIKTVDKSEGRSTCRLVLTNAAAVAFHSFSRTMRALLVPRPGYFEHHESGAPFLAEIDAMYAKIDAWFAANDPSNKPVRAAGLLCLLACIPRAAQPD